MDVTSVQTGNFTDQAGMQNSLNISGVTILMFLIYGFIILLMVFIASQRLFLRKRLTGRFFDKQTEPGSGGPDKLKLKINVGLDEVCQFFYEPKLLSDRESANENDFYRMKTVDTFSLVDKAFVAFNEDLKRPMGKDVCQHLLDVKSHSSGCLKTVRTNQLQALSELYIHARYGSEPFGPQEYARFQEISSNITVLRQRITLQKISKDERRQIDPSLVKRSASGRSADKDPLL